ncbi:MAG: hypothetical protein EOP49_14335 [Sphingobacteriales bacterium]|nr:MAG: hypothetical protein EOP49_14335 [Sphingobacteriales bacterium]
MKTRIVILIIAILSVYIVFNRFSREENRVFAWDKSSYYLYLPALIIYDDVGRLSFYQRVNEKYNLTGGDNHWALYEQKATGRLNNKYAVGTALLELPFFLAAHGLTIATGKFEPDGFSAYYRLGITLSGVFYMLTGLMLMAAVLRRYFSDGVTAFTVLLTGLGTNLYTYVLFDPGMSHPFSFFLFAWFIYLVDSWYRKQRPLHLVLAGVSMGLIIITRPTNIILLLIAFTWSSPGLITLKNKLQALTRNRIPLLLSLASGFLVACIQLGYWKYTTGHWIHFSYEDEGFAFHDPKILDGLFSYRKGWFLYTPMALLGVIGLIPLWKQHRQLVIPVLSYIIIAVYIVFSWQQWWYGGGFGARPMIESLSLLMLPLAALVHWGWGKGRLRKGTATVLLLLVMGLNMFQSYQFSMGVLPWDFINKEYYWRVFGKLSKTDEDWKLLDLDRR